MTRGEIVAKIRDWRNITNVPFKEVPSEPYLCVRRHVTHNILECVIHSGSEAQAWWWR